MQEGWAYAYQGKNGDMIYTIIKAYEHNGLKGFYFVNYDKDRKEIPLFIMNGLGVGFYFMRGDDLYTVPIAGMLDLDGITPSRAVPLLTSTLKDDQGNVTTKLQRNTSWLFYQVTGPETVTVPAGTFTDCMKVRWVTVFHKISDSPPVERAVWLARGVGIVKKLNFDEYTFELVEFMSPDKVSK